jgi:hypothetical protein
MGFLNFLKGIGGGIMSGLSKVAGFAGKIAPIVSGIAGAIPTPFTQGLAQAANVVGGVANAVGGSNPVQGVAGALQGTPLAGAANQVAGVVNQAQNIGQAVQNAIPAGVPVM